MEHSFSRKFGVLLLCAVLGLTAFAFLYDDVAPRASVDMKYDRNEIKALANNYMKRLGNNVEGLQQDLWFKFDGSTHLQSHAEDNISPKKVLSKVNSLMYRTIDRSSFVSMLYAILDTENRKMRFARAGQCPVVVAQRNNEQGVFLTPKGMALGLEVGKVFDSVLEEQELDLNSGEVLVFYTDGFTEAMNESGDEFGETRLLESIARHRGKPANDIITGICKDVDAFAKGIQQHDDMTMVVVKVG